MDQHVKRDNCGACASPKLELILDLGNSPIADAYTSSAADASIYYPLQLAVCHDCWLVQLLEVVDQKTLFGTGYSFYSSASYPLSAYHEQYAYDIMNTQKDIKRNPLVVEVGCNDGDMLRHFAVNLWRTVGVDPAEGPAAVARTRADVVLNQGFTHELARELRGTYGPAEVVIANHVLAHVEDVQTVVAGISELLSTRGRAFIEVQYLPDLLLGNAFDLVYHEHRNFFSLSALENVVKRFGMHIANLWTTQRQGGSLRVELWRADAVWADSRVESLRTSERWLNQHTAYAGLQGRAERLRTRLLDTLDLQRDGNIVGYGAPAKATTLLNFCGLDVNVIKYVTDTTVAKQGRFIPGTGIQIISPTDADHEFDRIDTYLLLAWNYTSDIMSRELAFTHSGGRWIVPIPVPTLI